MHHGISTVDRAGAIGDLDALHRLLDDAAAADGRYPLSDHLRLELAHGGGPGFAAITVSEGDRLAGYAQLATINGTRNIELTVDPAHRADPSIGRRLLATAIDLVAHDGGGPVQWWAFEAAAADAELAAASGLSMTRELLQMRVALPIDRAVDVRTRPFEPGRDEDAFLAVNNRAFATHPEQGGWTRDTVRQREDEAWFDPAGFLLHERDGRLAAFCWTKVHRDESPVLGEIYVIAVDPDFQGLGLGNQLTLAGLASIAARGVTVGMLYVDGGNTAAVTMYEHLGFHVHRTDLAFTADIASAR
ncbi:MAG TPA: mycothiol synthase [Ilumatobacteraceae bacterium]|nr:mycothiol synthase [Ilumatobacteraceae bacterium]